MKLAAVILVSLSLLATMSSPMYAQGQPPKLPTPSPSATPTPAPTATGTATDDDSTTVHIGGPGPLGFDIPFGEWIGKFLRGFWAAIGGKQLESMATAMAGWLTHNPDITSGNAGMADIQSLTSALLIASLSLTVLLFAVRLITFLFGEEPAPAEAIYRTGAAALMLAFYRPLVHGLITLFNTISDGVLTAGSAPFQAPSFASTVVNSFPSQSALWSIVMLVAVLMLVITALVRIMAFIYLLVLYIVGPLMIPLGIMPSSANYFTFWWQSALRVLVLPVVWSIEIRILGAIISGLGFQGSFTQAFFAPFASLAMLFVMFKTPSLMPGPTPSTGAYMARRQLNRGVDIVAARAAGGFSRYAGTTARAAAAAGSAGAVLAGEVAVRAGSTAARSATSSAEGGEKE